MQYLQPDHPMKMRVLMDWTQYIPNQKIHFSAHKKTARPFRALAVFFMQLALQ